MPRNVKVKVETELIVQVKNDEEEIEVGNIMSEMEHDFSIFDGNRYTVIDSNICKAELGDADEVAQPEDTDNG